MATTSPVATFMTTAAADRPSTRAASATALSQAHWTSSSSGVATSELSGANVDMYQSQ